MRKKRQDWPMTVVAHAGLEATHYLQECLPYRVGHAMGLVAIRYDKPQGNVWRHQVHGVLLHCHQPVLRLLPCTGAAAGSTASREHVHLTWKRINLKSWSHCRCSISVTLRPHPSTRTYSTTPYFTQNLVQGHRPSFMLCISTKSASSSALHTFREWSAVNHGAIRS